MDTKKILHKIGYWIYVLFLAYIIFELLRKILGGSLGFDAIIVILLSANLAHSFSLNSRLSEHIGWHKGQRFKK